MTMVLKHQHCMLECWVNIDRRIKAWLSVSQKVRAYAYFTEVVASDNRLQVFTAFITKL